MSASASAAGSDGGDSTLVAATNELVVRPTDEFPSHRIEVINHGGHFHAKVIDPEFEEDEKAAASFLLLLLFLMIASQLIFHFWKTRHPRSFHQVTLVGFWLIPFALGVVGGNWRYCVVWVLVSAALGRVVWLASRKPLGQFTPRLVYSFFSLTYRMSIGIGAVGVFVLVLQFSGILFLLNLQDTTLGMLCLFYGIYFGILSRDLAEVCADQMHSTMGYSKSRDQQHLDSHVCGICGQLLMDLEVSESEREATLSLPCKHTFHEFCIRGWTMVGKKDSCPFCSEKVDLARLKTRPWDGTSLAFAQALNGFRYLTTWYPVIFFTLHGIFYFSDWLPHSHHHHTPETMEADRRRAQMALAEAAAQEMQRRIAMTNGMIDMTDHGHSH